MGDRNTRLRRPVSLLGREILRRLPAGPALDTAVLILRPHPGDITGAPGPEVLAALARERNLYGEALLASTSTDFDELLNRPAASKRVVRRALVRNRALPFALQEMLLHEALGDADPARVIGLLESSATPLSLMVNNPTFREGLSDRPGQPGARAVTGAFLRATLQELERFQTFTAGFENPRNAEFCRGLMLEGVREFAVVVNEDRHRLTLHEVLVLARLMDRCFPGVRFREFPWYLLDRLAELPGSEIVDIARAFKIPSAHSVPDSALSSAGRYSLEAALEETPKRNLFHPEKWCLPALHGIAAHVAAGVGTFDQFETFESLFREWGGNLGDLLLATQTL